MKAQLHLAPRRESASDFSAGLRTLADELRRRPAADGAVVHVLQRLADDPLGRRTAYRGTLEVSGPVMNAAALTELLTGLGDRVAPFADPARSALLLGAAHLLLDGGRAPVRYQYLMRRRPDFDHDAYLKRYLEVHAEFGLRTPGILGYSQLHVDLDASRSAAEAAGIGVWEVDSVSELQLASVAEFFAAVSKSTVPAEAAADEERFVDRARSHDYISCVDRPAVADATANEAVAASHHGLEPRPAPKASG